MKLSNLFKRKKSSNPITKTNSVLDTQKEIEDKEHIRKMEAINSSISGMQFLKEFDYHKAKECFVLAIENGRRDAATYRYLGLCFRYRF